MTRVKQTILFFCFFLGSFGIAAAYQNPSNGVYGGYVGSTAWFGKMRQTAENQAMLRAISGSSNPQRLPPDYVEFAGQIVFPEGNPFPKGRIPDLRIVCHDRSADAVERAPRVAEDGSFYTVFRKSQTYEIYWMYYFGSREKFASVHIRPEGAGTRKAVFSYEPVKEARAPASQHGNSAAAGPYDRPRTGPGLQQPAIGPGYKPPQAGPGFQRPAGN